MFILSWMCQFHWDCGFDDQKFAVNNRHYFFLVNYGDPSGNYENIPIL